MGFRGRCLHTAPFTYNDKFHPSKLLGANGQQFCGQCPPKGFLKKHSSLPWRCYHRASLYTRDSFLDLTKLFWRFFPSGTTCQFLSWKPSYSLTLISEPFSLYNQLLCVSLFFLALRCSQSPIWSASAAFISFLSTVSFVTHFFNLFPFLSCSCQYL